MGPRRPRVLLQQQLVKSARILQGYTSSHPAHCLTHPIVSLAWQTNTSVKIECLPS